MNKNNTTKGVCGKPTCAHKQEGASRICATVSSMAGKGISSVLQSWRLACCVLCLVTHHLLVVSHAHSQCRGWATPY